MKVPYIKTYTEIAVDALLKGVIIYCVIQLLTAG